jgi:hypothetical protein
VSLNAKRAVGVTLGIVVVGLAIGLYIALFLLHAPGAASAQQTSAGTSLYLASVPAAKGNDPHPTWVSYYAVNPGNANWRTGWRHDTTYVLPAHSLVHVTIYQYDGASGLRNPFISQAVGTVGGTFQLNGTTTKAINPNNASHVFAIPNLGISVPLLGVPATAKNPCANAPCSPSMDHETISFTIHTPGKGLYRWQCFVPCAAGYIEGFGGPMQTVGYMDGFIKVV